MAIRPGISTRISARLSRLRRWDELLQFFRRHQPPLWLFRGQRQHWALRPSIGRSPDYDPAREIQLFNEFKRLSSPMVDRSQLSDDWDWLFVAQHHGLRTRLLDWTTNPLVAAFFACQPSPKGKRHGEIIAVRVDDVGLLSTAEMQKGPFAISRTGFLYPSIVAPRIASQKGLFSIHSQPDHNWILRSKTDRFSIQAEDKAAFLSWLYGLGVDAAMIRADLDGVAANLSWRYDTGRPIQ